MKTTPFTIRPIVDLTSQIAVDAFNAGFSGYIVPISMTIGQFEARFRSENLDRLASHVWFAGNEAAAILLIARRGWTSRVAAIGVSPNMRGAGLGLEMMRRAVSEARERGDTSLILEVFEDNFSAVKLYGKAGFTAARPLYGFSIGADRPARATDPVLEIDPAEGAMHSARFGLEALPWQLQLPSLAALVRPFRCLTNPARSVVAMVDPTEDVVRLRALSFVSDLAAEDAAAFTNSLCAAFPGRAWSVPPIFPDFHRQRFFEPGGWKSSDMRQLEMRHALGRD